MTPATRNDSQTADPALAAASPIKAKMPAPTMEPMPSAIAPRTVTVWCLPNDGSHGLDGEAPASDDVPGRGGVRQDLPVVHAGTYMPAGHRSGLVVNGGRGSVLLVKPLWRNRQTNLSKRSPPKKGSLWYTISGTPP